MDFILKAADFMWANVIGYVLLAVGLYYSIRLGFPQFRHAGLINKVIKKNYQPTPFNIHPLYTDLNRLQFYETKIR